ncbi:MAG: nascent polypeptide-associated complex protein [Caldisphaera sp.]|nr:nascent polypeptide-associated complex protein [Caldisphaera sp.]
MGVNPKDLKKAMKRMGMEMEELKATNISINTEDGSTYIVDSPQVMIIKARGQPTMLYIIGEPKKVENKENKEIKKESIMEISEEDIKLVMDQTGVDEATARNALRETNGDIAEAILRLKGS